MQSEFSDTQNEMPDRQSQYFFGHAMGMPWAVGISSQVLDSQSKILYLSLTDFIIATFSMDVHQVEFRYCVVLETTILE